MFTVEWGCNQNVRSPSGFLRPVFIAGWSCIASIALWQLHSGDTDKSAALTTAIILLASLAFSRVVLELRFNTAPMLYLALLGLFHLGVVVPWALGIYDISHTPGFVPYGHSRALAMITYSILVFQLGLLTALGGGKFQTRSIIQDEPKLEDSKVFKVGSSLFLLGSAMFVIGLVRLGSVGYDRLTYSETFRLRAESDPRFFGMGITIALIGLSLAAAGGSKQQMRITYVYTGFWFLTFFYLGFRSPAITAALLVFAVASKKGVRWPRWAPLVAGLILLIAIPVVRVIREEPLDERSLSNSLHEMSILDGPAEMGSALRPLTETLDLIGPGNYRYGMTYLRATKGILPNLALRWEAPATESIDDLSPGHWVTAIVDPWAYKNHGGMGFSGVAEPYMNFGIAGVVVYFFLLAILLVRLEQISIRSSYSLAMWALLVGPLMWTIRNDFKEFFRPAVWGLLCLGVIRLLSSRYTFPTWTTKGENLRIPGKVPQTKRI
jgi:oligosaccharide repeat unit polymerase